VTGTVLVCALLVAVGLAGIVVPLLPGTVLVALGIGIWAGAKGTTGGWVVFGVAAGLLAAGAVVKYVVPGRRLQATVPTRTLVVGALCGVVGFFVIPVVGALAGFPVGVYLAERMRVGSDAARASTGAALRAVGASILIELLAALAATLTWVAGMGAT
jgi:uncharacterized protein YqgC (DUF456 family)